MWWFAVIFLYNAWATPQLNLVAGITLGGVSIKYYDILLYLGPILMLASLGRARTATKSHPAYVASLVLFGIAFTLASVVGFFGIQDGYLPLFIWPMRVMLTTIIAIYMGYRVLQHPAQCRTLFWIVFIGSLGSALIAVFIGGETTATIASTASSSSFNDLRTSALAVTGDAGLLAACVCIFAMVQGLGLLPKAITLPGLLIAAAGMFFIPHRSHWLANFLTCLFAAFWLWPRRLGRKIILTGTVCAGLLLVAGIATSIVQTETNRDFGGWVQKRLQSMLPDDTSNEHRAWDTRTPGLVYDLNLWLHSPLYGGGFGIHEANALRTGNFVDFRHTPWTSTLAETGLIGFAAYATLIGGMIILGTRLARTAPDRWMMLLAAAIACHGIVSFIFGCFTFSWNLPRPALTLGLFGGLIFRCRDLASNAGPEAQYLPLKGSQFEHTWNG